MVSMGKVKSGVEKCRFCSIKTANWWASQKFGRLTMAIPEDAFENSGRKVMWSCECGSKKKIRISHVATGLTTSCGDCRHSVEIWWQTNIDFLRSKLPLLMSDFPTGGIRPLEDVTSSGRPFRALCPVCGSEYGPRLSGIRNGVSLTCGCVSNVKSSMNHEVSEYLSSIGLKTEMEYTIQKKRFDVAVPDRNFVVEMQGLRYHVGIRGRDSDAEKRAVAAEAGLRLVAIFEDEWAKKKSVMKAILASTLNGRQPTSVRPSKCDVRNIDREESDLFYDLFHYLGGCKPTVSHGAYFDGRLVACMSFSRPTRQSSHQWELVRMASDPAYRVHGIWSKLFGMFVREHSPSSVVSFSDNRLFTGAVYGKLGFALDGEVRPDYYWVKNNVRYHKSGLRKKGAERTSGLTETQLREAQGYRKIWDYGKKRWIWRPPGLIT